MAPIRQLQPYLNKEQACQLCFRRSNLRVAAWMPHISPIWSGVTYLFGLATYSINLAHAPRMPPFFNIDYVTRRQSRLSTPRYNA